MHSEQGTESAAASKGNRLEIARLWENGTWDTELVEVPFDLDDTAECWEQCQKYVREVLNCAAQYRKCATVLAWDIVLAE